MFRKRYFVSGNAFSGFGVASLPGNCSLLCLIESR